MSRSVLLRFPYVASLALAGLIVPKWSPAPVVDPSLYAGLVWRNVGPFRGGRIAAVSGVIGEPGVFYVGLPAGGVWKTTSAGETWYPVFDSVRTVSSVGAIEVAPSDSNVIYAGTGDMATGGAVNEGDGVYKSADAGRTWQHLGLDATKQIPSILVDPRDPNLVMVAAQGNVHQRSDTRGVFRSTDGGRTWTKTLYVDDQTGAQKLAWAYDRPSVVFATTVRHYQAPGAAPQRGGATPDTGRTGTALYKSTDEGVTWRELSGNGLPRLSGRTSVAVAMNTNAQRVFLIANSGLYRSDDGGTTWRQMAASDERIRNGQGGYNCGVYVDPKNPDIVYTINTSSYKSTDGGNTFTGFKGAPGGDDPQQMWIDPTNGQRILLGLDQGAVVTLDGGKTWSSWYNQSTEQIYHLAIDNSFPYWIYATQQDAGAVRTRARGNYGAITPLDWDPVGGWEWGTIVPDPLNSNLVYASGAGIVKISYPSEQWINVSPAMDPSLKLRTAFSQPLVWAPWDQHELLAGFQYLMATTDGGVHWRQISPDLGEPKGGEPALASRDGGGNGRPPLGGAIESISPSTAAAGTIWVGTNNGLIKLTRDDGKTWEDVSIAGLPNATRADISTIDASHTDPGSAYAAIDYHTTGDYAPYIYRTRDYGKTWTKIVDGLPTDQPTGSFARFVRADTKKSGLLFAGTEAGVFVSFDDGDHWQSLMQNLPVTSYRDMMIHDNDLIVATYGRGIWVLDDYAVLRQITPQIASEPVHLFKPDEAIRVRRNVNADTPFPPEVPHALNPPDGALIYYTLASRPAGEITLDVKDASGVLVRHMSSTPERPVEEAAHPPEPSFWLAPPFALPANAGINRVNWDLRYDAPPAFRHSYEINANPGLTPPSPEGPLAPPGTYTITLTVNGRTYTQSLTVRNDPRSPATIADIEAQSALLVRITDGMRTSWDGYQQAMALRAALRAAAPANAPSEVTSAVSSFEAKLDSVAGNPNARGNFRRGQPAPPTFFAVNGELASQLNAQDNGDMAPTTGMLAAFASACNDLRTATTAWQRLTSTDLGALNTVLSRNRLHAVPAPPAALAVPRC